MRRAVSRAAVTIAVRKAENLSRCLLDPARPLAFVVSLGANHRLKSLLDQRIRLQPYSAFRTAHTRCTSLHPLLPPDFDWLLNHVSTVSSLLRIRLLCSMYGRPWHRRLTLSYLAFQTIAIIRATLGECWKRCG